MQQGHATGTLDEWRVTYRSIAGQVRRAEPPGMVDAPAEDVHLELTRVAVDTAQRITREDSVWIKMLVDSLPSGNAWLLDLAACEQISQLKGKNVSSYFLSLSNTTVSGTQLLALPIDT